MSRRLLLALVLLASPAQAREHVECDTLGIHLRVLGPAPDVIGRFQDQYGFPIPGQYCQAYRVIYNQPELTWVWLGVAHGDTTVEWPRGRLPVLTVQDTTYPPVVVFAVGAQPDFKPIQLGRLKPGDLEQTKGWLWVFAGYRGKWDVDSVRSVRLEKP